MSYTMPDPATVRVPVKVHPYVALARSYRQAHGITCAQMANALGVKPKTLEHWEFGKAMPRQEALDKLAKFFNIKPDSEKSGKEAA